MSVANNTCPPRILETSRFVQSDSINNELICCICSGVLVQPVECRNGHDFCFYCISKWLQKNKSCPFDREVLTIENLKKPHSIVISKLNNLQIHCDYAPDCDAIVRLEDLEAHKQICPFEPVVCPNTGCEMDAVESSQLIRNSLSEHLMNCEFRKLECELGCGEIMQYREIEGHLSNCVKASISCMKCNEIMERKDFVNHQAICLKEQVTCFVCSESLLRCELEQHLKNNLVSHFFAMKERNKGLRTKIAELATQIKIEELRNSVQKRASSFQVSSVPWQPPINNKFNVILLGDSGVGKTCIAKRFANASFEHHMTTIGTDFMIRKIKVGGTECDIRIWDTAGQERFRSITTSYFRGAHGIGIVYDVTDTKSFHDCINWFEDSKRNTNSNVCKILIGNKCDYDSSQREVTSEEGKALAVSLDIDFFEVSAKNGKRVDDVFYTFGTLILDRCCQEPQQNSTAQFTLIEKKDSSIKSNCC